MEEKRKYWLFVTNDANWKTIKDKKIFGFDEKGIKDLKKLTIGDLVIIYIKGKKIGGIFEIKSLKLESKVRFREGNYPYKIKLKKILIPKEFLDLTEKIINNISIFRGLPRWGVILMGRATKEIQQADFYYIKNILEK
jgi:predicted RNA-binding protein